MTAGDPVAAAREWIHIQFASGRKQMFGSIPLWIVRDLLKEIDALRQQVQTAGMVDQQVAVQGAAHDEEHPE